MGEFIRLQKILAQAGFGSRRSCETFILEGRVTVDGAVIRQLGTKADPESQVITLDGEKVAGPGRAGKRLQDQSQKVYYALNKPVGVLCTNNDPSGRPLAIQMIPEKRRLFCIGRLDLDTEGLLLLTNDGELTHLLTHPRFGVPKTYMAKVDGPISGFQLAKLKKGVFLSEGRTQGALVRMRKHGQHTSTLELTIQEGLNRQIRRMLAAVGLQCRTLRRVKIGPLSLGLLPTGAFRLLGRPEVEALRRAASQTTSRTQTLPQDETEQDLAATEGTFETTAEEHEDQELQEGPGAHEDVGEPEEQAERPPRRESHKGHEERTKSAERRPWDRRPERGQRRDRDDERGGKQHPRDARYERRDRSEGSHGERRPYGNQSDRQDRGERRPYEKRPDRQDRGERRPYERRPDRQDRGERRPYEKRPDRQDRGERRPYEKRPDRQDRGERRPYEGQRQRYDERPRRRDDRERRPFSGPREERGSEQRSGYRGRPQNSEHDRKPGPRGYGGQGHRPWQNRSDDRQRGQGGRGGQGGQRRDEGRRDQGRREEH